MEFSAGKRRVKEPHTFIRFENVILAQWNLKESFGLLVYLFSIWSEHLLKAPSSEKLRIFSQTRHSLHFHVLYCVCWVRTFKNGGTPNICSHSNPQKRWLLTYMAKHVIQAGILRGGAYPWLSRWVLNLITDVLKEWGGMKFDTQRSHGATETKIEAMWPQAKETSSHQKLKRQGITSTLEPLWHLDFGLPASKIMRE